MPRRHLPRKSGGHRREPGGRSARSSAGWPAPGSCTAALQQGGAHQGAGSWDGKKLTCWGGPAPAACRGAWLQAKPTGVACGCSNDAQQAASFQWDLLAAQGEHCSSAQQGRPGAPGPCTVSRWSPRPAAQQPELGWAIAGFQARPSGPRISTQQAATMACLESEPACRPCGDTQGGAATAWGAMRAVPESKQGEPRCWLMQSNGSAACDTPLPSARLTCCPPARAPSTAALQHGSLGAVSRHSQEGPGAGASGCSSMPQRGQRNLRTWHLGPAEEWTPGGALPGVIIYAKVISGIK